jgi:hypothetical protein
MIGISEKNASNIEQFQVNGGAVEAQPGKAAEAQFDLKVNATAKPAPRPIDPEALRRLAAKGYSASEIARLLGHHRKGICYSAKRHSIAIIPSFNCGPQPSAFWQQHDADLTRLVATGLTATEIAHALGVTKNAVIGRANRSGLVWAHSPKYVAPPPRRTISFPERGCCLWPHGHPSEVGFCWCSAPVVAGRSYCQEHQRRAYRGVPAIARLAGAEMLQTVAGHG